MTNKKTVMAIVSAVLLFIAGLVFLLDAVDVAFSGAISNWYILLLAYLSCLSIAQAVVARAPIYVLFAFVLGGTFVALLVPKTEASATITMTWPIILVFLGLGLIVTHFISKKRLAYLKIGLYVFFMSLALLVAAILDGYVYAIPTIAFITAVCIVLCTVLKHKNEKRQTKQQVIYVEPKSGDEV